MKQIAFTTAFLLAGLAAADSIELVRGRAQLASVNGAKATVQLEARKFVNGTQTRTGGQFKLVLKKGLLAAQKLREVSTLDKTGVVSGPAVFHTRVAGKPVRVNGTLTVTVVDLSQPKNPSGTPDTFQAVFTPATGAAVTFSGVVAKGDLVVTKRVN